MSDPSQSADPLSFIDLREDKNGLTFPVVVQPRALKNGIVGIHGQAIKIRLAAPPVDGKANAACIAFLAKKFGVEKKDIKIIRGENSRKKLIHVTGIDLKTLLSRLALTGTP